MLVTTLKLVLVLGTFYGKNTKRLSTCPRILAQGSGPPEPVLLSTSLLLLLQPTLLLLLQPTDIKLHLLVWGPNPHRALPWS